MTIPAHFLVDTHPTRPHYWRMYIYFLAQNIINSNGQIWIVPLLNSVSDITTECCTGVLISP